MRHSFGAYIAARFAAEHPDRVAGLLLANGGMPFLAIPDVEGEPDADDLSATRMETPCRSAEEYLAGWRSHAAFLRAWSHDMEACARYDMVQDGNEVRCVVSKDAIMTDTFELVCDGVTRTAVRRVRAPVSLLCASCGAHDENRPLLPREQLEEFVADHPHVSVEHVPDTNHYTLILGDSPGPATVAAAIHSLVRDTCRT